MALRLAWRDAWRHKGRSALILALIALPVAGMTVIVLLLTSSQMTTQERIDTELGTAQARLTTLLSGGPDTIQDPLNPDFLAAAVNPDQDFVPADPSDVAPDGYAQVEETSSFLELQTGDLPVGSRVLLSDLFHQGFGTRFSLVEGSASADPDAVYLSASLAARLDFSVGDELVVESGGSFEVAGIIRETGSVGQTDTVYAAPGTALPHEEGSARVSLYLFGDSPLTWPEIREMNSEGVGALSRTVLLDPPPASELPGSFTYQNQQTVVMAVLGASVVGVLVLAEVGLLAGAAFAVGARNQRRMLALVSAAGGERSMVPAVVTASGVVLGAAGAAVGLSIGVAVSAAVVAWHAAQFSPAYPGFHLVWWPLAVFGGLGFLAAVVASAVPAKSIAAQNAFTALKSAQSASRPARTTPRAGLILIASALLAGGAGVAVALSARTPGDYGERLVILAPLLGLGTLLLLLGVLFCTGRIVDLLSRLAARLPVAFRMAARDASRNRGRSVPSIAAVLAATAVAGIVVVSSATFAKDISDSQLNTLNDGQGSIHLVEYDEDGTSATVDHRPLVRSVETVLGMVGSTTLISGIACTADKPCVQRSLTVPEENSCATLADRGEGDVWSCRDPMANNAPGFPLFTIGGPDVLEAVLGHEPPESARTALEEGKLVVFDPSWIADGEVTIVEQGYDGATGQPSEPTESTMPAVATEADEPLAIAGVMTAEAADSMGVEVQVQSVMVELPRTPTPAEHDEIHAAFREAGSEHTWLHFPVPPPPAEALLWTVAGIAALVALTSSGITAGLALADGRADHMTLAGIGAAPKLRKSLAAAQTALTAAVGVTLGLLCGVLPAAVVFSSARQYELIVPWPQLAALAVLVPVVGAGAAWLFTRARLPMSRRALLQ